MLNRTSRSVYFHSTCSMDPGVCRRRMSAITPFNTKMTDFKSYFRVGATFLTWRSLRQLNSGMVQFPETESDAFWLLAQIENSKIDADFTFPVWP